MSTAVAYPPSHSSSRPPSNPDAHRNHSSSSPRNYQTIAPARPSSTGNQHQNTMAASSPTQPSPSLVPKPSAENVASGSQHLTASANIASEMRSPTASKLPQPKQQHSQTEHADVPPPNMSQMVIPSVEVKKERPPSPEAPQLAPVPAPPPRHRPRKLDLTTNMSVPPGRPSAPMTSKDSAPLTAMQDFGLACLSPGFQTEDPRMTQQLQRSMDMREQQRQIIEARLQRGGDSSGTTAPSNLVGPPSSTFSKPPGTSKRKGPPPGLTITAPSAHQFASEPRVIQSAPLHQSFTGLGNKPGSSHMHPLSRQVHDTSHQHRRLSNQAPLATENSTSQQYAPYIATPQTATRLPPIQDVLANDSLVSSPYRSSPTLNRANSGPGGSSSAHMYAPLTAAGNTSTRSPNSTQHAGSLPSPAYPPPPQSAGFLSTSHGYGNRDFKSADEAVHAMAGGREELLPKIVHYGGHQPPTPPSPLPPGRQYPSGERQHHGSSSLKTEAGADLSRSTSGRRRTRDEYEGDLDDRQVRNGDRMDVDGERERGRNAAPQGPGGLGFGFGAWSAEDARPRSPETMRRKKEEFLSLCARAWELMHE